MKKVIMILALVLITAIGLPADDVPFRLCRLAYHTVAFADYHTTFHASGSFRFEEQNVITRLYWRSSPAFSAVKAVETAVVDWMFRAVYRRSKFLGYVVVAVFAVVRVVAFRDNMRVMGVR